MASALKDTNCTCSAAGQGRSSDCPLHGTPYKPNPLLAGNAWVQPYVPRQS